MYSSISHFINLILHELVTSGGRGIVVLGWASFSQSQKEVSVSVVNLARVSSSVFAPSFDGFCFAYKS